MKFNDMEIRSVVAATVFLLMLATSQPIRAESELWNAFTMHRYEQAEKLIRHGWFVNVNEKNSYGAPLIHHAVYEGTPALVELLISKGAKVNAMGRTNIVALHLANRPGMAKMLLSNGALVDAPNNFGETPLHWAASSVNSLGGQADLVEFAETLIAYGADVNKRTGNGRSYRTPLSYAAESNNFGVAKVLIAHGADVNVGSADPEKNRNSSPLNVVSSVEMAKFLVANVSIVNPTPSMPQLFMHPLISAASRGLTPLVEFFLDKGADPNVTSDTGLTPLMFSSGSDYYTATTELLLKRGATPNARLQNGHTALHQASLTGSTQIAKMLLNYKADVNAATRNGWTPLFPALRYSPVAKRKELVELLIANRADVNVVDENGETPLHQAVDSGQIEFVKLLIANGANINPPCSSERCAPTLLYFARNSKEISEYLMSIGAPKTYAQRP
jgi:ankyrin repeat protein